MKPTKNSYFCIDCNRTKMVFPSKEKAERFMKFNADEIFEETGKRPIRAYYCIPCAAWHITSQESNPEKQSATECYFNEKEGLMELIKSLGFELKSDASVLGNVAIYVENFYNDVRRPALNLYQWKVYIDNLMQIFEYISHTIYKNDKKTQKAFSKFVKGCELYLERKNQVK